MSIKKVSSKVQPIHYPTATEKELSYYVSNQALDVIKKDYVFVELVNPVYTQVDNQVTVIVTVKYLDKETKVTQFSQFELALQKNENWKIIRQIFNSLGILSAEMLKFIRDI